MERDRCRMLTNVTKIANITLGLSLFILTSGICIAIYIFFITLLQNFYVYIKRLIFITMQ